MSKSKLDDQHYHDLRAADAYNYNANDAASKCTPSPYTGKKRSWTAEEDAYLIKLVQKYGAQKWTTISENLPGTSEGK
jgi:hypothetical protein